MMSGAAKPISLYLNQLHKEGDYKSQQKLMSGLIYPLAFPDIAIEVSQLLA